LASSGVGEFDRVLGGGFSVPSAILIEGPLGGAKEFMLYSLVRRSSAPDLCVFVTKSEVGEVMRDARAYGIEIAEETVWVAGEGSERRVNLEDLASLSFSIKEILRSNHGARIRIATDVLSSLLMLNGSDGVYRFLDQLITEVKKYDAVLLATIEAGMHSEQVLASIEHLFDGVLVVEQGRSGPVIRVKRIKGVAVSTNETVLLPGRTETKEVPYAEERRLVAIMFTDIVGYTALTQSSEKTAMEILERHNDMLRPIFSQYGGKEVKTIGDAFLVEFESALGATLCAAEIQKSVHGYTESEGAQKFEVRIGIHLGDVIRKGQDVFGDAVNIASRIQPLAEPGGICISGQVFDQIHNKFDYPMEEVEHPKLKNVLFDTVVYRVVLPWQEVPKEAAEGESIGPTPSNLPRQTPLVGRKDQIESAWPVLLRRSVRVLTLTGPGGIGKSAMGIEVARSLLESFPAGVYLVSLASISDTTLVLPAIAEALVVKEQPRKPILETLEDAIGQKQELLILDNFEQLVASSAHYITELSDSCPRLKFIVTSRKPLHITGEHEFAVPPLQVPSLKKLPPLGDLSQNPSVALFLERSRTMKPDFDITEENAQDIAEICTRLEGLPLAIELAAARVRILPPGMILSRLGSRLGFLTGGPRDASARQQTLRNTIAWSHDLLDESERKLFRRLAVFAGGFTVEDVEGVCAVDNDLNVLDDITGLVENSLVRRLDRGTGEERGADEYRFDLLESIHEFAAECLKKSNELNATEEARTSFFLNLAQKTEPKLNGPDAVRWLATLESEHDNMRASLAWCIDRREAEKGLRLAGALGSFWEVHSHLREGRQWLDAVQKIEPLEPSQEIIKVLVKDGVIAVHQGDYKGAHDLLSEAHSFSLRAGDRSGEAHSLRGLAFVASRRADFQRAASLYEESADLFRGIRDDLGRANALKGLGWSLHNLGDAARAKATLMESVEIFRRLGDRYNLAVCLNLLGQAGMKTDDYNTNRSLLSEGIAISEELHDRRMVGIALMNLGELARLHGRYSDSIPIYRNSIGIFTETGERSSLAGCYHNLGHSLLREGQDLESKRSFVKALNILKELGEQTGAASCLAGLAGVAQSQGEPERAAKLLGAAEAILERNGARLDPLDSTEFERYLSMAKGRLGPERFLAEEKVGREMTFEKAIEYALES
jgi:predicted ATPase/class 3 adenylate cyclase